MQALFKHPADKTGDNKDHILGIGTWAIGGVFYAGEGCRYPTGRPLGYGEVDDDVSMRALHCAFDMGAMFFDTADAYGTGHGERVLGRALKGCRDKVFIATKFGNTYDESTRELTGTGVSPQYIRQACAASLRRLQTDWIDLYQLHLGDLDPEDLASVTGALDELRSEGLIRHYGWSTDDPTRAIALAEHSEAAAVQFDMNVLQTANPMLRVCEHHDLAAIIRSPLAMGFLGGKFSTQSSLPRNDIRSSPPNWLPYFTPGGGAEAGWLSRLNAISEILRSGGRSNIQGALSWIWGKQRDAIPIPGIRSEQQARENLSALEFGPLTPAQLQEIDVLLGRD